MRTEVPVFAKPAVPEKAPVRREEPQVPSVDPLRHAPSPSPLPVPLTTPVPTLVPVGRG